MSLSLLKRSIGIVEESEEKSKKPKLKIVVNESYKQKGFVREKEPKRLTIEEIKSRPSKEDKIKKNIAKLQRLSKVSVKLDEKAQKKIIERAQTGHYVIPKEEIKKEESIFTEEDFKKFEQEYFG